MCSLLVLVSRCSTKVVAYVHSGELSLITAFTLDNHCPASLDQTNVSLQISKTNRQLSRVLSKSNPSRQISNRSSIRSFIFAATQKLQLNVISRAIVKQTRQLPSPHKKKKKGGGLFNRDPAQRARSGFRITKIRAYKAYKTPVTLLTLLRAPSPVTCTLPSASNALRASTTS